jgi:hypothetical protein
MSSIDDGDGFPDNPLSRAGVTVFVGAGILIVGMLLVTGINALFPLRPPLPCPPLPTTDLARGNHRPLRGSQTRRMAPP